MVVVVDIETGKEMSEEEIRTKIFSKALELSLRNIALDPRNLQKVKGFECFIREVEKDNI